MSSYLVCTPSAWIRKQCKRVVPCTLWQACDFCMQFWKSVQWQDEYSCEVATWSEYNRRTSSLDTTCDMINSANALVQTSNKRHLSDTSNHEVLRRFSLASHPLCYKCSKLIICHLPAPTWLSSWQVKTAGVVRAINTIIGINPTPHLLLSSAGRNNRSGTSKNWNIWSS